MALTVLDEMNRIKTSQYLNLHRKLNKEHAIGIFKK
jgi:hypothetical protein